MSDERANGSSSASSEGARSRAVVKTGRRKTWYEDAATVDRLVASIKLGTHYEQACRFADITPWDLSALLARGDPANASYRGAESLEAELRAKILTAEAAAHNRWLVVINQGMTKDPRLALNMLERRYPQWARKQTVDVNVHGGFGNAPTVPRLDLSLLTDEQFQQFKTLVALATPLTEQADTEEEDDTIEAEVLGQNTEEETENENENENEE